MSWLPTTSNLLKSANQPKVCRKIYRLTRVFFIFLPEGVEDEENYK